MIWSIIALFIGISYNENALYGQNFFLQEGFENGAIPAGWITYDLDEQNPAQPAWEGELSNSPWIIRTRGTPQNNANKAVSAISWFNPASCCADDWLITPAIALSDDSTVFLRWKFALQQSNYPDGYRVLISTTGNSPADFENGAVLMDTGNGCAVEYWACNCNINCSENFETNWGSELKNISSYAGQTIYLAFHHNANNQFALYLDDIEVYEPFAYEAALVQNYLPSPYAELPLSQVTPWFFSARIFNNGLFDLHNVKLGIKIYNITTGTILLEDDGTAAAIGQLNPSATLDISNGSIFLPDETGIYRISYRLTADETEADLSNNADTLYYHISENLIGRDMVFIGDTLRQTQYIYDFPQNAQEGFLTYIFQVANPTKFFGSYFQVGRTTEGIGYNAETPFRIELNNESDLLSKSGTLTYLNPQYWQMTEMECVDLVPGIDYYLSYHQLAVGGLGMIVVDHYFDSGVVSSVTEVGGFSAPGQPSLKALVGDTESVTELDIDTMGVGLSLQFYFTFATGKICHTTWYFEDGTVTEGLYTNHSFSAEGTYHVCVNIDGDSYCEDFSVFCALEVSAAFISTATILADVDNGVPPLSFEWSNGSTSNPATGLTEETAYTVTVTDAAGCVQTANFVTLGCALSLQIAENDNGGAIGIITGGLPPYQYIWYDNEGIIIASGLANFIENLTVGYYSLTVTDSEGCIVQSPFLITGSEDIQWDAIWQISPSPADEFFLIRSQTHVMGVYSGELFDINGKWQKNAFYTAGGSFEKQIDVSDIPDGIYLLKISSGAANSVMKIIIAH